ncbi:hypothetical protein Lser_V15G06262 [Lactuca serriola]
MHAYCTCAGVSRSLSHMVIITASGFINSFRKIFLVNSINPILSLNQETLTFLFIHEPVIAAKKINNKDQLVRFLPKTGTTSPKSDFTPLSEFVFSLIDAFTFSSLPLHRVDMDMDVDKAPDTQKIVESLLSVEVCEEAIVMAQGSEPNMAILPDAGELVFDYLRDNLAGSSGQLVMRWPKPFRFAIDDKVDYVLIDEGRNPLLISGEASKDAARYPIAAKVVELLMRGLDNSVELIEEGIALAEMALETKDL